MEVNIIDYMKVYDDQRKFYKLTRYEKVYIHIVDGCFHDGASFL